ncbi:serine hydrolase domain-containing protein [Synoicihabitans lomoniglobus]|uniref:Serine hydrolase n=1 Tax=Synoicihabitans lomoniglobus TaxID=2909285 RepID=A0AAF0CSK1_9BACT|nr:beta-lactamase family protein [Opitutaceae bacterium LMO-M01]WED67251.1 serine hydrolase [Opitutaceae bacterium LMO-M01]
MPLFSRLRQSTALLALLGFIAPFALADDALPRSAPEAAGVSSTAVLNFINDVDANIDALHSFMLVRHGQVVAEGWWTPHHPDAQHMFFSLSKSFTSTAVGLAIAEGHLSLNDRIVDIFPEFAPAEVSTHLRNMRVRDLLAMNTGHHAEDLSDFTWAGHDDSTLVQDFLRLPVAHKPGTHFLYNTPATYTLAAAVEKLTGQGLIDYLSPRLFEPLGIETPHWDESKEGVALGGFGMRAKTEDIAKFGQLYLQNGEWNGRRLLEADYIAAATSKQTSNGSAPDGDWDQGYGYQFWRCVPGFYRGDGRFGQFCIVMPQYDAVIAITSGTNDMGGVMKKVWQHILPGLAPVPLPANPAAAETLATRLTGLTFHLPAGRATSPLAAEVSDQRFTVPTNESRFTAITMHYGDDHATFTADVDGSTHEIKVGYGTWVTGHTAAFQTIENRPMPNDDQTVGAAGAWTNDHTFTVRFSLPETTYTPELPLRYETDGTMTVTPIVFPLQNGAPFAAVTATAAN